MDLFGILHAGERESSSSKRAHILENSVLVLEIQEVGRREHHSSMPATTSWLHAPDHHELLRVLVRKGAKHSGVQGAENGSVQTDAQGQCQHGNGSKTVILAQHAQAEAQILPARLHKKFPAARAIEFLGNFETAALQLHFAKRIFTT